MVMHEHYIPTEEEISKYCNVEGENAFLTCPRFLRKLRSE